MDKRHLIAALLTSIILLPIGIVVPIAITSAVVSNNIEKELIRNRIEWDFELSYEKYNINRTNLCGCNYTDSVLVIDVLWSKWDNHSYYGLYIGDYWITIAPKYFLDPYELILNSTSLINGREIYRHRFFNDWTKVYNVSLYESFSYDYKVIRWWHTTEFVEEKYMGMTFSISDGFNWE